MHWSKLASFEDSCALTLELTIFRLIKVLDGHGILGRSWHIGDLAIAARVFKTGKWVVLSAGYSSMVMGV